MANREREALVRETFELNLEAGYVGFQRDCFNNPDVIKEWPDPAERELELRSFWDEQSEGRYESYCYEFANDSIEGLAAYRDYLRGLLAGVKSGQIDYCYEASAMGRHARLSEGGLAEKNDAKDRAPSPSEIARDPASVARAAERSRDSGRDR